LPESLQSLAEVLRLTIAGRGTAEFDGFVQLMDKRVLDPRLTAKLLRFQAAMLIGLVMKRPLKGYQFRATSNFPSLQRDLPLEVSLMGLLVEHALYCDLSEIQSDDSALRYVRRAIRGQNLDRAGLSAKHMKIMNLLSEPRSVDELQQRLGWDHEEVRRVLSGFVAADILEVRRDESEGKFVAYETNAIAAAQLRSGLKQDSGKYVGKIVRDTLTLQLLVKRTKPDAVFFAVDTPQSCDAIREAFTSAQEAFGDSRKIVLAPAKVVDDPNVPWHKLLGFTPDRLLHSPYTCDTLTETMDQLDSIPVAEPPRDGSQQETFGATTDPASASNGLNTPVAETLS
jgi:DNA-binding MarR family transcriptional regulator